MGSAQEQEEKRSEKKAYDEQITEEIKPSVEESMENLKKGNTVISNSTPHTSNSSADET